MSAERLDDDANTGGAHRIPRLFPPAGAFPSHHHQQQQQQQRGFAPADVMLGLKTLAAHADRQAPLLSHHDSNPMPTFPSLRVSALPAPSFVGTTRLPSITTPDASTATTLSPLRFGEYLGRKHKRGDDEQMPDDAMSPTARAQVFSGDRGITLSPPSSAAPAPRILPVATTIAWRSSNPIFAPTSKRFRSESPLGGSKDAFKPSSLEPQSSAFPMSALTRSVSGPASSVHRPVPGPPVLVRKASSKWRSELADQERRKTRERIQRGLTKHDERDYEVLLLLIASMEEELLHVKTTSREHYFQQAQELSSEIRHASLEH